MNKLLYTLLRLALAIAMAVALFQFDLDYIEAFFYDLRIKNRPFNTNTSNHIELIIIDQKTLDTFQGLPDFKVHNSVLEKILSEQPLAIGYVTRIGIIKALDEGKPKPPTTIQGGKKDKAEFVKLATSIPEFYQITDSLEYDELGITFQLEAPFETIKIGHGKKTIDQKILAKDGITRRQFVSYKDKIDINVKLAGLVNPDVADTNKIRGITDILDSNQTYTDYRKIGSFPVTKFEDIFFGKDSLARFRDKIILVGDDLNRSHDDYIFSPMNRNNNNMTVTEMYANMIDSTIRNSAPIQAPKWFNLFITIWISILTVHVVLTMRPIKGLMILLATAIGFSLFSYILFWPFAIWIKMAHPFIAMFLCYYFFIPYRLIVENKRSWEYYQKHKILSEVEELKTNFIGMMSHDLKTPLARIQGMSDVILRDEVKLSSSQREAVDTIKQSSEDLTRFISTILNYAKIESQGVELHLQAKDINQILKDVVKKYEFMAKVKHIQLITEFEPLFSIPVDPELMKQVFANLVENAIKYSPENSRVLITTEESNGKIIVQVADQGVGIAPEEIDHIFMKFFRSSYAKISPIKGSGLGLYLAKYFVELHRGKIFVESTPGQGSTFTVELPLT